MSDRNNNNLTGDPHWGNSNENLDDNQSPETDGDDVQMDLYSETGTEDGCTCFTPPDESVDMQDPSMNWEENSSPAPSSPDESNQSWNETEYESDFDYLCPDNAGDEQQAVESANNDTGGVAALPNISQTNDSRLDLRPVPASIDLTRNRASNNWREYHAHVRASTRRLPFPENRHRPVATAGVQRLCGGQPNRPCIVPMGIDPDYGGIIYIRNDTDTEEEPPLPPLVMVPRRGNSVSDLSQCSSEEETVKQKTEQRH